MARSTTPVSDLLLHPVRWRIVQRVLGREVTTTDLRAELSDVSTSTLYRQVAILLDAGVLRVVREARTHGPTERTLALRQPDDHLAAADAEAAAMTGEQHRVALNLLLAQITRDFERAVERGDLPARSEELNYGQTPLYLRPEQLRHLQTELERTLAPYQQQTGATDERRIVLSVIGIPDE